MITAIKTSYEGQQPKSEEVKVHDANHAFQIAQHVWKTTPAAVRCTLDTFQNGSFVTRVVSKEKLIFKIQYSQS